MEAKNWKGILASILHEHNERHGKRDKIVANLTKHQRGQRLYSCFQQLRNLGYKIEDPRNLSPHHIKALVDHWIELKRAPATIQTWLSHLRVYARWIGKPGLVSSPIAYITDPELVTRHYAAEQDASWSTRAVDIEGIFNKVGSKDRYVGNQLLAELLFGLRVKEAVLLRPWRDHQSDVLIVADGTKGGRPRTVPVEYEEQRQALLVFKQQIHSKNQSLADPRLTLKQAISRYYSVMRAVGVNKKSLGITSHGLRKEYANQQYRELTGVPSPIQGGPKIERATDRQARLEIMERLGHTRENIGTAYLGAIIRSLKQTNRLSA